MSNRAYIEAMDLSWALLHRPGDAPTARLTELVGPIDEQELEHEQSRRAARIGRVLTDLFPVSWRVAWAICGDEAVRRVVGRLDDAMSGARQFPDRSALAAVFSDEGEHLLAGAPVWARDVFGFERAVVQPARARRPVEAGRPGRLTADAFAVEVPWDVVRLVAELGQRLKATPWDHAIRLVRPRRTPCALIGSSTASERVVLRGRPVVQLRWLWTPHLPTGAAPTEVENGRELAESGLWVR